MMGTQKLTNRHQSFIWALASVNIKSSHGGNPPRWAFRGQAMDGISAQINFPIWVLKGGCPCFLKVNSHVLGVNDSGSRELI